MCGTHKVFLFTFYSSAYQCDPFHAYSGTQFHALFIETSHKGRGNLYGVSGNIEEGMVYEFAKNSPPPDKLRQKFWSGGELKCVASIKCQDVKRVAGICKEIMPPHEQFRDGARLYPEEELRAPVHWLGDVIEALWGSEIVELIDDE